MARSGIPVEPVRGGAHNRSHLADLAHEICPQQSCSYRCNFGESFEIAQIERYADNYRNEVRRTSKPVQIERYAYNSSKCHKSLTNSKASGGGKAKQKICPQSRDTHPILGTHQNRKTRRNCCLRCLRSGKRAQGSLSSCNFGESFEMAQIERYADNSSNEVRRTSKPVQIESLVNNSSKCHKSLTNSKASGGGKAKKKICPDLP